MVSRRWKVSVIILVLAIFFVAEFQGHVQSTVVSSPVRTYPGGPTNGTLFLVQSFPGYDLNVKATFSFTGIQNGPGKVVMQNGTTYTVNQTDSEITVFIHVPADLSQIPASTGGINVDGGVGVNLSSSQPVNSAFYRNFSYSGFTHLENQTDYFAGTHYVMFYAFFSTFVTVSAVVVPL